MYSLGVVTYFALTGKLPFAGATTAEILAQQARSIPPAPSRLNPRIPAALETLIFRLLAKDPRERLAEADRFCRELERARHGAAVTA